MRILRIANVADNRTGGMSRTMHATSDELRAMGHTVTQVFADEFHSRGPRQLHRYTDTWEALRLAELQLRRGDGFDVVEIHEPLVLAYANRCRRGRVNYPPVIAFSYGLEERGLRAMIGYRRLKRIRMPLKSRLTGWLLAWQAGQGVRRADHVICSNATDVAHLAAAGVPPTRLTQHHSGVSSAFLAAGLALARPNSASLIFVGTWIERKGTADLVPAFVEFASRCEAARLTIAGCGASEEWVRAQFPERVRAHVRVVPRIENDTELIALYHSHAIFVLPSYFEGQPLSLIEAAACGLVPVVTDVGGNRDFVHHNENGLLVPVGDPGALGEALAQLATAPELAATFGRAAQARARTQTWRSAARRILAAYAAAARMSSSA